MADLRRLPPALTAAVQAVEDRKGVDLMVLDLRGISDMADFFLIATGTSDTHVRGLSNAVIERLEGQGVCPHHVEGVTGGRWALIDFVDFVVHLFHPEARAFYQLERLWGDAPLVIGGPTWQEKGRAG